MFLSTSGKNLMTACISLKLKTGFSPAFSLLLRRFQVAHGLTAYATGCWTQAEASQVPPRCGPTSAESDQLSNSEGRPRKLTSCREATEAPFRILGGTQGKPPPRKGPFTESQALAPLVLLEFLQCSSHRNFSIASSRSVEPC